VWKKIVTFFIEEVTDYGVFCFSKFTEGKHKLVSKKEINIEKNTGGE
jgi:hypothetical protein